MRDIKEIIIHCTATRPEDNVHSYNIRYEHIKHRGFVDCGYHYIIDLDGKVDCMRPVSLMGAHCKGHNQYSVGIAYIGGLDHDFKPCDTRTVFQRVSLINLICILKSVFGNVPVYGHRDFANKVCPCFDATKEYSNITSSVSLPDYDIDDVDDL